MNFGTIIDESLLPCCGLINWPVGFYSEEEDHFTLVFADFPKDFIRISGKFYDGIEEYQFLQELMKDSFHSIVCLDHLPTTERETIRIILRDVIAKIIACFWNFTDWFEGDNIEIALLGEA